MKFISIIAAAVAMAQVGAHPKNTEADLLAILQNKHRMASKVGLAQAHSKQDYEEEDIEQEDAEQQVESSTDDETDEHEDKRDHKRSLVQLRNDDGDQIDDDVEEDEGADEEDE